MAKIHREKDYTVRFDEISSKLNRIASGKLYDHGDLQYKYQEHMGYYRHRDGHGGHMPNHDIKFSTTDRLAYKLHHGYSTKYIHKDHYNKLEDSKAENIRMQELYKQNNIDKHLDDYDVEISASNYNGHDILRLPVEIKL